MAVRINSISLDGNDRFTKINLPMSPVLNCRPSTPPSDQESCHKSVSSEGSPDGENSCCGGENQSEECSKPSSPIASNNNNIPLNFKKIPSPSETTEYRWNSSPRDQSISPTSSRRRNSASPNQSPRIPSHASSETHPSDIVGSPDNFSRSPKLCPELSQNPEVPPFHDSRISPDSFKYIPDPMNPYLRLPNPLNPFQPTPNFLGNPFLTTTDPKLLLNHHLISQYQQLNKIHPQDLKDFSLQQLQFLQNRLQNLPPHCPQLPFSKFQEKNQLSLLMQARKNNDENKKETSFRPIGSSNKFPAKIPEKKSRRPSDDVDSDSDELLSVGSESPPPNCQVTSLFRRDTDNESDAGSSSLDCSFKNRTNLFDKPKKYQNNRAGNISKSNAANNRTLKFSIDNILKSDFGGNEQVIPVANSNSNNNSNKKPPKEKKEKPEKETSERTQVKDVKKSEKESPVDLSQDNAGSNGSGSDTPMLWPAWVYCTRYSDRPSSGPRTRRSKNKEKNPEEKRPRTAFSGDQLSRLKHEFAENRYLTERRRQDLARELGLNEAQIKIWFQNKRAKMKKARGEKNPLALQLMAQGLYNHSTVPLTREEEEAAAAELSD